LLKKRISSSDVARRAGVSRTTVSFVLNNTPGKQISEETRQKVLKAEAELNYMPNAVARELAMIKYKDIGFFICNSQSMFSGIFIRRIIEGMSPALNKNRFQLILQPIKIGEADYLQLARKNKIDGIILVNTYYRDKGLLGLMAEKFPLVVIGKMENKDIAQVDIDNFSAAGEVVNYLANLGHKKISMIIHGPLAYYAVKNRLEGYKKALAGNGIPVRDDYIVQGNFSEESGYAAMQKLLSLKDRPTAVFAGNDLIAYGAIQAIKDAGFSIPKDISVIGFDDDLFSRYQQPPLTTMNLPAAGLAEKAVTLLIEQMKNKNQPKSQIILPTHLSVRYSCRKLN